MLTSEFLQISHKFQYLSGKNSLQSFKVVTLLVIVLQLKGVDGVAIIQGPQDDLAHVVRPLVRVHHDPE